MVGTGTGLRATLVADSYLITAGESATLRWTTSGASSARLDPGGETIAAAELAAGSKSVSPATTTTYTLTAVGGGRQRQRHAGDHGDAGGRSVPDRGGRGGDAAVDDERGHERQA